MWDSLHASLVVPSISKIPVTSVRRCTTIYGCLKNDYGCRILIYVNYGLNCQRFSGISSSTCVIGWWWPCDIVYDVNDLGDVVYHSIPYGDKLPDYVVYLYLFLLA